LQRVYAKYGEDKIVFSVLLICSRGLLLLYEQLALDALKPQYNILKVAGYSLGYKHTHATKIVMGNIHKGKHLSDAHKAALRDSIVGKPKSIEHRAKIAKALSGKPKSLEHRISMSAVRLGKPIPRKKGYTHSSETRAKISVARYAYLARIADGAQI
jgi:group I intron endonuclease